MRQYVDGVGGVVWEFSLGGLSAGFGGDEGGVWDDEGYVIKGYYVEWSLCRYLTTQVAS